MKGASASHSSPEGVDDEGQVLDALDDEKEDVIVLVVPCTEVYPALGRPGRSLAHQVGDQQDTDQTLNLTSHVTRHTSYVIRHTSRHVMSLLDIALTVRLGLS